MPTEQRVISSKSKIAPKSAGGAAGEAIDEAPAKGGKKKMILIVAVVLVVVVVAAAAAYWFLLKPSPEASAEPVEPEPMPGAVQVIESVSINLAGGHYLRLGLGLQLTAEVKEDVSTAKALDRAITLFSGRSLEEISDLTHRDELKHELKIELDEAYEGEVMDVYFTDFVSQ